MTPLTGEISGGATGVLSVNACSQTIASAVRYLRDIRGHISLWQTGSRALSYMFPTSMLRSDFTLIGSASLAPGATMRMASLHKWSAKAALLS